MIFGFLRPTAPPARPEIEDRGPNSRGSRQRHELPQHPRDCQLSDLGSAPSRDGDLTANTSERTSRVCLPVTLVPISDSGRGAVLSVDEYASIQTVQQLLNIVTVRPSRDDPRAPELEISEDGERERRWMLVGTTGRSLPQVQVQVSRNPTPMRALGETYRGSPRCRTQLVRDPNHRTLTRATLLTTLHHEPTRLILLLFRRPTPRRRSSWCDFYCADSHLSTLESLQEAQGEPPVPP